MSGLAVVRPRYDGIKKAPWADSGTFASISTNFTMAIRRARQVEEEYERFVSTTPPQLSDADRDRIRTLAADIPALWHAPETGAADRKEVIRCLPSRNGCRRWPQP